MEDHVPLPGFRFHPTDEELLSFYLRRKVEKKLITLGIMKEIDIYKINPWDLASCNNSGGDKEWYFFCRRERKYKNSVRPNRVTGCGFWKATGIDKSIYSSAGVEPLNSVIGLKKTLVFYRGSAGKGTKTDWMMHEFRLPSDHTNPLEAEIWTLCRIFKRNTLPKKHTMSNRSGSSEDKNSISLSASSGESDHGESYISFGSPSVISRACRAKMFLNNHINEWTKQEHQLKVGQMSSVIAQPAPSSSNVSPSASSFSVNVDAEIDLLSYGEWEELRSAVDFDLDPSPFL